MDAQQQIVPDTEHRGLILRLPQPLRDLALLARFDRPIGWWLLFWPCAWGVLLAGGAARWDLIAWLLLGSIAMRGAGCVYNDLVDADLDRQVARTAARPVASGRVSVKAAWAWLLLLCAVGLVVLLQLRWQAQLVSLGAILPVAAYPFMKRITWWPQAWLGLTFNWGALLGYAAAVGHLSWSAALLYASGIFWTLGYDTIYAIQDIEDDALAGIKSSTRRLGQHVQIGVAGFYMASFILLVIAGWVGDIGPLFLPLAALFALHLSRQAAAVRVEDGPGALKLFKSNALAGLVVFVGLVAGLWKPGVSF